MYCNNCVSLSILLLIFSQYLGKTFYGQKNIWIGKKWKKLGQRISYVRKWILDKKSIIDNHILYALKRHYLAYTAAHFIRKADVKCQPDWLDFFRKGEKSEKTHELCTIISNYACHRHYLCLLGTCHLTKSFMRNCSAIP